MANKEKITPIFEKLSQAQSEFTLEDDPIFQALEIWIEKERPQSELGETDQTNSGKRIASGDLHKELQEVAHSESIEGFPKSSNSFGRRFIAKKSDYRKFFKLTIEKGKGRASFYEISVKQ